MHDLPPVLAYLTNGVLVLIEECLQLDSFGGRQRSDLCVGAHRHGRRLGQQTVEQMQQGEGHQAALRCSGTGGSEGKLTETLADITRV